MPKPNASVKQGSPPFMPPVLVQQPPSLLGGGGPSPYVGPVEDGPSAYVNYDGVSQIIYNGQTQTGIIAAALPKPPRGTLPGAAPPSMSKIP